MEPVWKRIVEAADKYYEPGKFTTFAACEGTSTAGAKNLHRNIFFLDSSKIPNVPFMPSDSSDPRALWKWMDEQRTAGNEVLAISHNANLSNGVMFPIDADHTGRPIDGAWEAAGEFFGDKKAKLMEATTSQMALRKPVEADDDLFGTVLNPASDRSSTTTGQTIMVDGGTVFL